MSTLLLPCCYLAPASHYSALLHAGEALTEVCDHYRRPVSYTHLTLPTNREV